MTNPERLLLAKDADKPRLDPWKLRVWRKTKGITQRELAAKMSKSAYAYHEISRVERYLVTAGKRTLRRLAEALELTEADLLSRGSVWLENREKFEAWDSEGRPNLARWLRERERGA